MGSDELVVAVFESNGKCGKLKMRVKSRQAQSATQQVVKLTFGYMGYEPNMHERETHAPPTTARAVFWRGWSAKGKVVFTWYLLQDEAKQAFGWDRPA